MSRTNILAAAVAAIALAGPAAVNAGVGSWPQTASKPTTMPANATVAAPAAKKSAGAIVNGFEYIGGDGGWQLVQHRYVVNNGRLVHSEECDHAIRSASAVPTFDELETLRRRYPGG